MALWGNKDAGIGTMGLGSALSVNYGSLTVTGSGTTFGRTGAAATGDIIVFGDRTGAASTYFGTAVIASIASTTSLTIGSTAALNGSPISNISVWKVNESPIYATWDNEYSARNISDFNATGLQTYFNANMSFGISTTNGIGCGVSVINLSPNQAKDSGLKVGDFVQLSDGTDWYDHVVTAVDQADTTNMDAVSTGGTVIRTPAINGLGVGDYLSGSPSPITGTGSTIAVLTAEAIVGIETLTFNVTGTLPMVGDTVTYPTADADGTVSSVAAGSVGLAASLSASIAAGLGVTIQPVYGTTPEIFNLGGAVAGAIGASDKLSWVTTDTTPGWVSLGTTVFAGSGNAAVAIDSGSAVRLARSMDGYDAYVYGVSDAQAGAALSTTYEVASSGWVGVTTYTDSEGNLRVKAETLVAMSGITTEYRPPFPAYPNVAQ